MLSDRQKEQLSAEMVPLFQKLEQDVIQDIARRVRKESRWTETAEQGHARAQSRQGVSSYDCKEYA